MRSLSNLLAVPLALLLTSSVQAQDDDSRERPRGDENRRARIMAAFDENDDGALDGDEAARARAALQRARRGAGGPAARGQRGPRRGDEPGRADGPPQRRRERAGGPQGGPGPDRDRPIGPSAEMLLARFDADGDRELDLPELRRLVGRLQQLRRGGPGAMGAVGPRGPFGDPPFRGGPDRPFGNRPGFGFGGPAWGGGSPGPQFDGFGGPRGPLRDSRGEIRNPDRGGGGRPEDASRDRGDRDAEGLRRFRPDEFRRDAGPDRPGRDEDTSDRADRPQDTRADH